MNLFFAFIALTLLTLSLPYFGRMIVGPSVYDRLVAFNGIGTQLPLLLVLLGLFHDRVDMYVDLAMALLLFNFFTTLLIARYVRRRARRATSE